MLKDVASSTDGAEDFQSDVERVNRIEAVPTILDVVCRTTGMRFAAVARVTEDRWVACSVLDEIDFGLKPGGELKVETRDGDGPQAGAPRGTSDNRGSA